MNVSKVSRLDRKERGFKPSVVLYGLALMAAAAGLTLTFIFLGVQAVNLLIMLFTFVTGG